MEPLGSGGGPGRVGHLLAFDSVKFATISIHTGVGGGAGEDEKMEHLGSGGGEGRAPPRF